MFYVVSDVRFNLRLNEACRPSGELVADFN
jgi:hypothetical protein